MFNELPRYVGFPNQTYVEKRFSFNNFFRIFNGFSPFMVSTYQFKDRSTPIVNSIFFDIDSYFSVRFPYRNTLNLKKFCDRNNFDYIINYSGGKGFHLFIMFKPIIPITDVEKQELKDKLYSTQLAIMKECNLESLDIPTFARLHFLVRYPTSKYVREKETNGAYCRNLSSEEFEKGEKYISKLVKTPGEVPKTPDTNYTLDDIISKLHNYKLVKRTNGEDMISIIRAGMEPPTINALSLPCMKKLVEREHPPHYERVELVAWLKFIGYSDLAIITFIQDRHWTRYNYEKTQYQVSTIEPRYPDCKKLRESYGDLCEKCILNRRFKK